MVPIMATLKAPIVKLKMAVLSSTKACTLRPSHPRLKVTRPVCMRCACCTASSLDSLAMRYSYKYTLKSTVSTICSPKLNYSVNGKRRLVLKKSTSGKQPQRHKHRVCTRNSDLSGEGCQCVNSTRGDVLSTGKYTPQSIYHGNSGNNEAHLGLPEGRRTFGPEMKRNLRIYKMRWSVRDECG